MNGLYQEKGWKVCQKKVMTERVDVNGKKEGLTTRTKTNEKLQKRMKVDMEKKRVNWRRRKYIIRRTRKGRL